MIFDRYKIYWAICVCSIGMACGVTTDGQIEDKDIMTSSLIKGRITDKNHEGRTTVLQVKIEDVYFGPQELGGKSFLVNVYQRGSVGILVLQRIPKLGEAGIWRVRFDNKENKIEADIYGMQKNSSVANLPVFEGDANSYKPVEMWARDVHKVAGISADKRIGFVRQLVLKTDNYVTRAWAIKLLGEHGTDRDLAYLRKLVSEEQVPVLAQLVIDEVLCSREGKTWYQSQARGAILERWAGSPLGKQAEKRFVTRMKVSTQSGELTGAQIRKIIMLVESNPAISFESRQRIKKLMDRGE